MEEKVRHQPHDEESEVIDLLTPKKYWDGKEHYINQQ
jgi:hypothetical protein